MAAATGICRQCSEPFTFNGTFYAQRNLAAPRRCASCRAERLGARQWMTGTISSTGSRFSIVRGDYDARDYFVPGVLGLQLGARVLFSADPSETPAAGRRLPTAFDVQADPG